MFGKLFGLGKSTGASAPGSQATAGQRTNLEKRFTIVGTPDSQGSMSKVYKATDNQTGKTVCLKVQDAEKAEAAQARAGNHQTEGEIGKQVIHPHVARTYEFGHTTKGEYFMVLEFVDGHTLTHVRKSRTMDLATRLELLAQAAEGVAAVHAAGFIHRDIGPQNFLVNRGDQVKLIDFGLAVPNTELFRRPGNRTGTLIYMAPELVRREETDERIDIFSFGVTAFEFLTNRLPYGADRSNSMAVMKSRANEEPLKIASVAPNLPANLCRIFDQVLAKKPGDRWAEMATLPHALRAITESIPATQPKAAEKKKVAVDNDDLSDDDWFASLVEGN